MRQYDSNSVPNRESTRWWRLDSGLDHRGGAVETVVGPDAALRRARRRGDWFRWVAREDRGQQFGNLVDGRICKRGGVGPVALVTRRRQQFRDGFIQLGEAIDHHANLLFDDPVRVVALVRQRPLVALDDYGQPHGQRLADAAGTGLANEEIGEAHQSRHLGGESFDMHRHAMPYGAQFPYGLLVTST